MMSYNTKNYTEQGGEKTVIGGVLEVKEGGSLELKEGALIKGFPIALNQTNSAATTVSALKDNFNDLLAKLKDVGFMEFDTWNLSVAIAPITTEGLPITENQSKVSAVTIADNIPGFRGEKGEYRFPGSPWGRQDPSLGGLRYKGMHGQISRSIYHGPEAFRRIAFERKRRQPSRQAAGLLPAQPFNHRRARLHARK
jgi:hypothetical protein